MILIKEPINYNLLGTAIYGGGGGGEYGAGNIAYGAITFL